MKIIGLTGFAKSGKSTAAEILKKIGGQEVAFAKHLKDVCSAVLHVSRNQFDDQAYKEIQFVTPFQLTRSDVSSILDYFEVEKRFHPSVMVKHAGKMMRSPRQIAQYVGTELLRDVNPNIHIDMAFKLNKDVDAEFLICSDVRFANELNAVQQAGGIVIGISREAATPDDLVNLHNSEKEIPALIKSANNCVLNNDTMDAFTNSVLLIANEYLKG